MIRVLELKRDGKGVGECHESVAQAWRDRVRVRVRVLLCLEERKMETEVHGGPQSRERRRATGTSEQSAGRASL